MKSASVHNGGLEGGGKYKPGVPLRLYTTEKQSLDEMLVDMHVLQETGPSLGGPGSLQVSGKLSNVQFATKQSL